MPKANSHRRNGSAAKGTPYASPVKPAANAIFKMNTDLGQHILKNPGVAQAIVEKADLKQSDVSLRRDSMTVARLEVDRMFRLYSKSAQVLVT